MIAKLVNIPPISRCSMILITMVFMGFINQLVTAGPHIECIYMCVDIYI